MGTENSLSPRRRRRRGSGPMGAQRRFALGVVIPTALYAAGLSLFPIVWALLLLFFNYNPQKVGGPFLGLGGENNFVGLGHFAEIFFGLSQPAKTFRASFGNTLIFAFMVLPLNLVITLPLAMAIESTHSRIKTILRAIYFLPAVTSSVGVAYMWSHIFDPEPKGLFNTILRFFGLPPVRWLTDPQAYFLGIPVAMWAVVIAYLWQDYGYNMVIFIAALQNIPREFREAAMIDGANEWQIFWHVTLPLLRPTMLFVCVMTMISSFQVFDIIQVMTHGALNLQNRVMELDIYESAFSATSPNMGWAAACAFILLLVVLAITLAQMRLLRTEWEY